MTETEKPAKNTPSAGQILYDRILGDIPLRLIHAVTVLNIADLVAAGENSVEGLAQSAQVDAGILYRVMRTLAGIDIFKETQDRHFELTPQAELLRGDAPGSLKPFVLYFGAEWHYQTWNQLLNTMRTGESSYHLAFGEPFFDHLQKMPEQAAIYNEVMTSHSMTRGKYVAESYDFSQFKTLMDVGGGHGSLLASILKTAPLLEGIVFDLPGVSSEVEGLFEKAGVDDRSSIIEGSFFDALPQLADGIIMKTIIHDWDDEKALQILQNCREAVGPEGKVLLCELVVPELNEPSLLKMIDLEMLVISGGQERTEREYRSLLGRAGLDLIGVYPTRSGFSILEASASDQA